MSRAVPPSIQRAFDTHQFRADGQWVIEKLFQHLADLIPDELSAQNASTRALNWIAPKAAIGSWKDDPPANLKSLLDRVFEGSIRLHHPHFMGHQISPPAPMAALIGLAVDLLNNGMGVYEMGIAGTVTEQLVIEELAQLCGFSDQAGGVVTSGGSLANLTALLSARATQLQDDVWSEGNQGSYTILVSQAAHYCFDRAVRIMGWGKAGILPIPVNDQFEMRTDLLEAYHAKAIADNRQVVAVIGSACCTATGTFDNLEAIGEFCQKNRLWFHVDGAHGGASLFSSNRAKRLQGIHHADSVTIDFHKLLMTPALASALIFRDGQNAFKTFSQKADYLWAEEVVDPENVAAHDLAKRTFECTKQMFALKFYGILRCLGRQTLAEHIDHLFGLTEDFATMIHKRDGFELAVRPQSNILCFRFTGDQQKEEQLNQLNETIRHQIVRDGTFYLVQTRLGETSWLRTTISNPFTTSNHFAALLDRIESLAQSVS